jgi:3-(methylthio)propionyl---CoA ligase
MSSLAKVSGSGLLMQEGNCASHLFDFCKILSSILFKENTMLGLMQSQPLLISSLIEFADRHHSDGEIVSRRVEGDVHRSTWSEIAKRSRQVAGALDMMNLGMSERVATLAWNGYRHLELYFGVSGSGRVLHTINPRLHPDQVVWIANHAEDQVLCFDMTFLPIVQAVHTRCTKIKTYVAMCDADKLPEGTGIPNLISYEAWIAQQSGVYTWPEFDELGIQHVLHQRYDG